MATPFPFDVVGALRDPQVQLDARNRLLAYFADSDAGFTGRFFEDFARRSPANEFTADDLVAVSMLSVMVPPRAAATLLLPSAQRDRFNELLAEGPRPDQTLWEVRDSALDDASPMGTLYSELRALDGMGPTIVSKLMAAKRPHFVPIRDSVVEELLGAGGSWWRPMRELMETDELRQIIMDVSEDVVPDDVSLLRRLDVILWTMGKFG